MTPATAKRVLVTGVGGGVGQGVIKALQRIDDQDVRIVAADMDPRSAGLYGADRAVIVPAATDPAYIDEIVRICDAEGVDAYIPGTDIELAIVAAEAEAIEARCGATVVVSPPSVIELADDKAATARWLEDKGFPFAATWEPGELEPAQATFPLIVKPRRGFRSIGVDLVTSPTELVDALSGRTDDPIVQRCIADPDDEYTCTVVAMGEEISPVLALRRTLRSGDTHRATPVHDPRLEGLVQDVARSLGVSGPCNLQLRLDGDAPTIFEINARFSGTTPVCAELGFNPVAWCLARLWGRTYDPSIRWDAVVLRHWAETVVPRDQIDALDRSGVVSPAGATWTDLRP